MRWGSSPALVAAILAWGASARAEGVVDTSYGRVEGDLGVVAGVGGVVAGGGERALAELRVRYLETVGLFAVYEDGPLVGSGAGPERVLAGGVELRPLFLVRWLQGLESRRATLDFAVDSIALELGAATEQPRGAAFASEGALQAGVGVEVPLLGRESGPWLGVHAGVRWTETAQATGAVSTSSDREGFVALSLDWHQLFVAHVVDVGDEAPR